MTAARWINRVFGLLLVIGVLCLAGFLPEQIAAFDQDPGPVWLASFWIVALGLLASLCFANGFGSAASPLSDQRNIANGVVVFIFAFWLFLAWEDQIAVLMLALCVAGPASALIGLLVRPRAKRS